MTKMMINQLIVIFLFLSVNLNGLFSQTAELRLNVNSEDSLNLVENIDTLALNVILYNDNLHADENNKMPWIVALMIGLLTVATNIYISHQASKMNKKLILRQLDSSQTIAINQIKTAKENAILDFNKTVLSGNRIIWINEFRILISKVISICDFISSRNKMSNDQYKELRQEITNAELMLNPEEHKKLIEALNNIEESSYEILVGNMDYAELNEIIDNLKKLTIKILSSEWKKVKQGR